MRMHTVNKHTALTIAVFLSALCAESASAVPLVAPSASVSVEGNSTDGGIFGDGGGGDFRIQTVYQASEFISFGRPIIIPAIAFRPDASTASGGGPNSWNSSPLNLNMLIRLSTTPRAVDGLSSTFSENVGSDQTTVVNGQVSVSSSNALTSNGTKAFDILISFATPFTYDPTRGNLLLDSRTFSGNLVQPQHTVDSVMIAGDSVSSVYSGFGTGGSTNALTNSTFGLIVQFTVSPVPEPSAAVLFTAGALVVGLSRRRRNSSPASDA